MNLFFFLARKRIFLLIFFLTAFIGQAQTDPPPTNYQIPVQGKIVDDEDNPVNGAVISVTSAGKQLANITTGSDGKYAFQVPPNGDYLVTISGPLMVTKKFMISARGIPPERIQEPFGTIQATVGLWKKVDGVDYSALNQPANKYFYNPDKQNLEYDKDYLDQMLQLIDQIRGQEKNLEKKNKEAEKNYQAALKKGDAAFAKKDWAGAKAAYTEAGSLKPNENYPKTQIADVDAAIKADADAKAKADADAKAKADADAKAKADLEAKYALAIKKGDDAFKAKDWTTAKAGYNEALGVKAGEKYPKDQLSAIDKAIADEKAKADADAKAKAELDAKYAAAVKKGDDAFAKKDWVTAKAGYNEAHGLKAAEKYPADQLALIDKAIADDAAAKAKADADAKAKAELEAKYASAIKKGDDAFKIKDWASAKAGYNEAHGLKAAEKYPADQLAAIDKAVADEAAKAKADADAKAKAELDAKYTAAVKKGDDAFKAKDWAGAKAGYNEAHSLKAAEKYPTDQLALIDKAIADDAAAKAKADADAKAKAELDAKYTAAVKKGDDAFAKKDWATAKAGYNEAHGLKSAEKYPADQLAAIDKAMADEAAAKAKADADAKAKAELEAKYVAAIKKGDEAFAKKDWTTARVGYNEALTVKAGEKYPTDKLAAIDKAIADEKAKMDADAKAKAEAELKAKYDAAIKKGDASFAKKDWEGAKTGYKEALGIKPGEKYPTDQLAAIDKAIADEKAKMDTDAKAKAEAEVNAKYAAAVKKGDDNFKKKDWENARAGYNEALTIKAGEKYPTDQLAAIDKAIEDGKNKADADAKAKAEAELKAKYDAAIKKGDDAFKKKDWTAARAGYNEALGIKAGEKYPTDQLAAIDKAIADEKAKMDTEAKAKAEAEVNAKYAAAIKMGDDNFKKKDWENARAGYNEALNIKAGEQYPADQLAAIDKAIEAGKNKADADAKAKAEAEVNAKYAAAIKKGDDAFKKKDWIAARAGYNEALGIKAGEKYPTDQLAAIDKAIEDGKNKLDADAKAKAEAELNAKYLAAVKKGDAAFAKKDWPNAKAGYTEALGIKPAEKYPKDQIAAIDKAIADARAASTAQSNEVQYKAAMVRGDNDVKFKKYKEAVAAYTEALTYKPNDAVARTKLADAQKNLSADDTAAIPTQTITPKGPNPLTLKYPQGITEETKSEPGVYIVRRIVVKGDEAWVYTMKKFNWGGQVFYKDDAVITQSTWDNETR